jgi:hypothetical protein
VGEVPPRPLPHGGHAAAHELGRPPRAHALLEGVERELHVVPAVHADLQSRTTPWSNFESAPPILLSFLLKKNWYAVLFLAGFILVTYFKLSMMGCAIVATILAVTYYKFLLKPNESEKEA